VGLTTLPCKKKIVEKPPRNSAGFCGGGQGLSWSVEPRKERRRKIIHFYTLENYKYTIYQNCCVFLNILYLQMSVKLNMRTKES
jgi:hypothetical protein